VFNLVLDPPGNVVILTPSYKVYLSASLGYHMRYGNDPDDRLQQTGGMPVYTRGDALQLKACRSLAEASYNGDRALSLEPSTVASLSTSIRQSGEDTISSWTNLFKPSAISFILYQPRKITCGYYRDGDRSAQDGHSASTHIRDPMATASALSGRRSKIYGCPSTDGQLLWHRMKSSNQ